MSTVDDDITIQSIDTSNKLKNLCDNEIQENEIETETADQSPLNDISNFIIEKENSNFSNSMTKYLRYPNIEKINKNKKK